MCRAKVDGAILAAVLIAASLLVGCSAHYVEPAKAHKVLVCHKGKKTLEVADDALDAHLAHGDHRGSCP